MQVTKEEYQSVGSMELGRRLVERLRAAGRRPCLIPVGGSSALGCWGYLEAAREIQLQAGQKPFTDIAMARPLRTGSTVPGSLPWVQSGDRQGALHRHGTGAPLADKYDDAVEPFQP